MDLKIKLLGKESNFPLALGTMWLSLLPLFTMLLSPSDTI